MAFVKTRSQRLLLTSALMSVMSISAAYATVVVPAEVDASRVQKRLTKTPEVMDSLKSELPLPGEPKEMSKEQRAQLEKVTFTLKTVSIEGVTAYKGDELKSTYDGMVGQKISLFDAQMIARKITAKYRGDGYVLSQAVVPQQTVSGGTLKIRVVEGYIANVIIQGDIKGDGARQVVEGYAQNIKAMRPVRTQDLERYLLLINDLPGASVSGLLRPAVGQVGAADLVITSKNKAFEASYSLDNRGSEFIGPWQHSVSFAANSLFGMYDRTELRLITTSPTTELRAFDLQHDEVLGDDGTKLSLQAAHTYTEPGDSLKNDNIVGHSELYSAKVSHPFIRSRKENLSAHAAFDFRNSDTDINTNTDYTQDRLRVARLGGTYTLADSLRGNNSFDLDFSKGLNIFNASDEKNTSRTNANGESDFSKFNLDISRLQTLPSRFSLLATASAQYSMDPLFVSEQFALGGTSFGGAYDSAEILGDHGIAGKLELRYTDSLGDPLLDSYQLYTYYDIGRAWVREGGAGANDKLSLASAAVGVRTNFTDALSGTFEVAQPLTKPAKNQGDHGDGPRIFVGTTARF